MHMYTHVLEIFHIFLIQVLLFSDFEVNIFQCLGTKMWHGNFDVLFGNFPPLNVLAQSCKSFIYLFTKRMLFYSLVSARHLQIQG